MHIEAADGPAVLQVHEPRVRRIARDLARALHRIAQDDVVRQAALLEQREHAGGGADLQRGGERAHVRVADQQMQPAIFAVVGERLVARVDDGAVELHPLVDVVDDVIGALADLEIDARGLQAGSSKSKASGLAWPTRPAPVKIWRVARKASNVPRTGGVNCTSRRMR